MLSKKQKEFLLAKDPRITLLYGSVRSGKTWISLLKYAIMVGKSPPETQHLIVGRTITTLKRNCLLLMKELVGDNFTYSLSQKTGKLFGRTVFFEGANDERAEAKIRGLTLASAYVDELTLIPEDFYKMLLSRLSYPGAKLFATTNPGSPSCYVKKDIIDNDEIDKKCIKFTLQDNDYLDPEYVLQIKKEYTGVFYERYILGNFVQAEGVIYRLFADNNDRYLIDDVQKYLIESRQAIAAVLVGCDWGHNSSANSAVAIGITRNYKEVIVLDEFYTKEELDPKSLYDKLVPFIQGVITRYGRCVVYGDNAEGMMVRGLSNSVKAAGLNANVKNCIKCEIIDRIVLENSLLARDRIKIHRNCKHLITALNETVWDPKSSKDERQDLNDGLLDPLDCLEYGIAPYMKPLEAAGHLK